MSEQLRLLTVPVVALMPMEMTDANRLLTLWVHKLGPVNRPFRQEAWALELDGRPIAVATSGSIVSPTVAGYTTQEVVELTRLCAEPGNTWANRVMLRLWREVCAPRWPCWTVKAAISYSHNGMHKGSMYRTDGWEKVADRVGTSKVGGTWGAKRVAGDPVLGSKSLWVWRYAETAAAATERPA